MKKRFRTWLIAAIALSLAPRLCFSQEARFPPLVLGDTIPDIRLKMINYRGDSLSIGDLRNRIVILDFWSVWCGACIEQFPKLKKLQDKYGGDLFILPVGFDVSRVTPISRFYEKRKGTKLEIQLPTAVQTPPHDSPLRDLFPFRGLPHCVWLNQYGQLVAVTGPEAVTEEYISRLISIMRKSAKARD